MPTAHPEAEFLRRARQARHLSIPAAAAEAGISHQRWGQIERSERGRAPAETIAHMAHAVGISAERLGALRPGDERLREAAEVLEEIEVQKAAGASAFERNIRNVLQGLPNDERSVLEEFYAGIIEHQKRDQQTLEKLVNLLARRPQPDHDR